MDDAELLATVGARPAGAAVTCRCNRAWTDIHLCHAGGYTCPRPGRERRHGYYLTVACDEHWVAYLHAFRHNA